MSLALKTHKQLATDLALVIAPFAKPSKKRSAAALSTETEATPGAPPELIIFSDGACQGNGTARGACGSGVYARDGAFKWQGRCTGKQTSSRAELFASIVAAAYATFKCTENVIAVHSDSEYVVLGMQEESRLLTWVRNGWKTKARKPVANVDLWRVMHALHLRKPLQWVHVPGHSGIVGNEAADDLAGKAVTLFQVPGTLQSSWPSALLGITLDEVLNEK